MIAIGCTGGIGAGKSTVAAMLAARGATVIDADALARAALAPDGPGYGPTLTRFGPSVVGEDGTFDRAALARIVFHDDAARRDLEAIVHPIVAEAMLAELARRRAADGVIVLDVSLLVETDGRARYGLDGVLVVDAPEDIALERLVAWRGLTEVDARARIAAQMDRFARLRAADFVILNVGTLDELEVMADNAWRWIAQLHAA